jgi:phytoene synthase
MLYAWCRHCDDVIDGQTLGHGMSPVADAPARLEALYAQTRAAMAGQTPTDPVFAAFQTVALRRGIPERYALDMIDGFAMDVAGRRYATLDELLEYCWGVAGVVGTMMALVMGVKPDALPTLRRAQDLGLAFQLTNIARDIVEDARNDRVYVPRRLAGRAGRAAGRGRRPSPPGRRGDPRDGWSTRPSPTTHRPAGACATCRSAAPGRSARRAGSIARSGWTSSRRATPAWDERVVVSGRMKVWRALEGGVMALRSATLDRWARRRSGRRCGQG